jgi:hypothetical protein
MRVGPSIGHRHAPSQVLPPRQCAARLVEGGPNPDRVAPASGLSTQLYRDREGQRLLAGLVGRDEYPRCVGVRIRMADLRGCDA